MLRSTGGGAAEGLAPGGAPHDGHTGRKNVGARARMPARWVRGVGASRVSVSSEPLSSCNGTPLVSTKMAFESTGREVIVETCPADALGNPQFAIRDSKSGVLVDLAKAALDDTAVFHDVRGGIGAKMQHALDAQPQKMFDVEVWLRVDLSDSPEKADEVMAPVVAADAAGKRELRTRDAAKGLVQKLAGMPGVQVVTDPAAPIEYGVPILRAKASRDALYEIGKMSAVWRVMPARDDDEAQSFNYNTTIRASALDVWGYDGTGQTVAVIEGNRPDAYWNLPGDPGGNCAPDPAYGGPSGKCHCPSGATGFHSRVVMGVVRANPQSIPFGGVADDAITIAANWSPSCTSYGPDAYSSALNWATNQGARVINRSEGWVVSEDTLNDGMQSSRDFLLDYKTSVSPFPIVVAGAGNAEAALVVNRLRNGLVVGGSEETGGTDRALVVMPQSKKSSYLNPNGPSGFEVPHLTAISEFVSVVPAAGIVPTDYPQGGTSIASPQVAAIVAQLHEINPALRSWPEVVVPGMMVTADENVDAAHLNMHDGIDDRDGGGLVNAETAWLTLNSSRKIDGGAPTQPRGHDYGSINSASTPTYVPYYEEWNAFVPALHALRAAALLQSRPACPTNPGCSESTDGGPVGGCTASSYCSSNPFVIFSLQIYDGNTLVAAANNTSTSYQFIRYVNTSGLDKTYKIKIVPLNYNGLTGTTWGVAWYEQRSWEGN